MDKNNPYKRSYKTKREEYQEKLKQKSDNQGWLFGNIFGKPGSGAPLRDNQGNVVSSLKSVTNNNIYKYEAQDFSKGNNNISVLNHKIYNQNNIINDPFSLSYDQINKYSPNQNITSQNNRIIDSNQNTLNNINSNKINNMTQQNYSNNNILIQPQLPYGYILPYNNIIPYNQIPSFQLQNQVNNLNSNYYIPNNYNILSNYNNIEQRMRRNNTAINSKNNYLNESNKSNNNININKQNKSSNNISNINNNDKENDYLLISNDNDLNNKIQNEKKIEEWKNDLKLQIEEKKKRDEKAKKDLAKQDYEERIKYQEYLKYKNRQAEENKKNKKNNQKYKNQNCNNILEMSNNELEKSYQTIKNTENKNDEIINTYNINNPLNEYNIPPEVIKEQENFKNFIDQQYETLGESLGQNIYNEIMKMSSMLTNKYEPYQKSEKYDDFKLSKFNNNNVIRNDKRMEKIQDIIEERELLDFILGQNDSFSPFKYKNYDLNKYNKINNEIPSYFGKNIVPYEKKFVNLDSDSYFLFGDYSNRNVAKGNERFNKEEYGQEQQKQNNNINNYNDINNNQSRKFGRNKDDINVIDSIAVSQSLDNKTSFVPLNNDVDPNMIEEINKNINDKHKLKNHEEKEKNDNKLPDKIEENIVKNLNEIDKLNKNVILYDIDKSIVSKYNMPNNNSSNIPHKPNYKRNLKNERKNNDINNNGIEEKNKNEAAEDNINNEEKNEEKKNEINEEKREQKEEKKEEQNEKKEEQKEDEKKEEDQKEEQKNEKISENKEEKNDNLIEDNNLNNKKVSDIGIQSQPNETNNKKQESSNGNEINIKTKTIETEESNINETGNDINSNTNKENSKEQNNKSINESNEEIEENYEESGEEEDEEN